MASPVDELVDAPVAVSPRPRPLAVFASGPFRKLWLATALSLFGDFFNYVAMAWLVLQLTGSSLALGTVLLVQALPRAVLMLVGGALAGDGLGGQIVAGFRYAWADIGIRVLLIVIAVVDFGANAALGVGLPTLAHGRFAGGAAGLGVLLGAWGVGATAGALGAGFVSPPKRFGRLIVFLCVWLGLGIGAVGLVPSLVPAALAMGLSGVGTGVVNTYGISWLQRRIDPAMQGRVMSLVMLASMGMTPVAYAVSGPIANVNPTALFVIAGGLIILCGLGAAASRSVRSLR